MIPEWHKNYIEIPFAERGYSREGVNCWGLVYLIYKEQLKIDLPTYQEEYVTPYDLKELAAIAGRDGASVDWVAVEEGRLGDVAVFNMNGGFASHSGFVLGEGWMINARRSIWSCCEQYTRPFWKRRLKPAPAGIYRHRSMV